MHNGASRGNPGRGSSASLLFGWFPYDSAVIECDLDGEERELPDLDPRWTLIGSKARNQQR